jgi:hypothetical protein
MKLPKRNPPASSVPRDWGLYGLPDPPNDDYRATAHEVWITHVLHALFGEVRHIRKGGCDRYCRFTGLAWALGFILTALAVAGGVIALLR